MYFEVAKMKRKNHALKAHTVSRENKVAICLRDQFYNTYWYNFMHDL